MVLVEGAGQMGLKERIPVGRIALESLFIVMAAMVALFANSWREDRAAQERAAIALEAIEAEARANANALREAVEYHGQLLGRLYTHDGEEAPSMTVFSRGFVAPANLSRHAWQSAANTGALEAAPYQRVLELESAYQQQARYEKQVDIVSGEIYRLLFEGGTDRVQQAWRSLRSVVSTLVFRECDLIGSLSKRVELERPMPAACIEQFERRPVASR